MCKPLYFNCQPITDRHTSTTSDLDRINWHVRIISQITFKLSCIVLQNDVLFGTNSTGKFFLWIIRWAQHSIAAGFNMVKQNTISIRNTAWD